MHRLNRRDFLRLAAVAGAAVPMGVALAGAGSAPRAAASDVYTFRAVAGLPALPLPTIASHVLSGRIDRATGTGVVTQTVFAGAPTAMSTTALPGMARVVRITKVEEAGSILHLRGVVDDQPPTQPGAAATVEFQLDRARGLISAGFFGSESELRLQS